MRLFSFTIDLSFGSLFHEKQPKLKITAYCSPYSIIHHSAVSALKIRFIVIKVYAFWDWAAQSTTKMAHHSTIIQAKSLKNSIDYRTAKAFRHRLERFFAYFSPFLPLYHANCLKNSAIAFIASPALLSGNIWNTCHISGQLCRTLGTPAAINALCSRSESE